MATEYFKHRDIKNFFNRLSFGAVILVFYLCVLLYFPNYIYLYTNFNTLLNVLFAIISSLTFLFPFILTFLFLLFSGLLSTRKLRLIFVTLFTCYFFIDLLLAMLHLNLGVTFDPFFVLYNLSDAIKTISAIVNSVGVSKFNLFSLGIVLFLFYFGLLNFFNFLSVKKEKISPKISLKILIIGFIVFFFFLSIKFPNETTFFFSNIFNHYVHKTSVNTVYQKYFVDRIEKNRKNNLSHLSGGDGKNLFFVQLESLNFYFVNKKITPSFISLAEENGIIFPRIQSASVQTIRAQEVILCSVLPSLYQNLAKLKDASGSLNCLPKILKENGYRTLFFMSYYNSNFANTKNFMKTIGFEEVHDKDIMKPEDKELPWGYQDDIFYKRVFEYLENFKGEKIFVYLAPATVNHYPFSNTIDLQLFKDIIPYPNNTNFFEDIANTTFLQDFFLGKMYSDFFEKEYSENSHLFIFGDHPWPIGLNKNNFSNMNGAWQENFLTSLVILPAKNSSLVVGRRNNNLFSQIDLLPTALELLEFKEKPIIRNSFLNKLENGKCLVSVQPYSGAKISIINSPFKYIFDTKNNIVSIFDIGNTIEKLLLKRKIDKEHLDVLEECLKTF